MLLICISFSAKFVASAQPLISLDSACSKYQRIGGGATNNTDCFDSHPFVN
jgi:hypothetical protein